MKMIVTTSLGEHDESVREARRVADDLGLAYVRRQKRSVQELLAEVDGLFVVYRDRLVLERKEMQPLFFHPDTASLRLKTKRDPLLDLLGPSSKRLLDATLGLGSDSLLFAAAGHQVTGLECSPYLHYLVARGFQTYQTGQPQLDQAMRTIETVCIDSLTYLSRQPDKSYDIVYFDPMFPEKITESHNLDGLHGLANPAALTPALLKEAKRVARHKILLKTHFRDSIMEELGFERLVRPNQKIHYGQILLADS